MIPDFTGTATHQDDFLHVFFVVFTRITFHINLCIMIIYFKSNILGRFEVLEGSVITFGIIEPLINHGLKRGTLQAQKGVPLCLLWCVSVYDQATGHTFQPYIQHFAQSFGRVDRSYSRPLFRTSVERPNE